MATDLELLKRAFAERYPVSREIGRGGMATVYLAHDVRHDRPVALKVLTPQLAAGLATERFLREIALTARLDHPHILPLLDSGEADGLLYYVMPYVDGESLRNRLDREIQLPLDDATAIAREVAGALAYAHEHGIVHRDIKPENILLASGHARVADFGIARAVTAAGNESLTATGLAVGTVTYMSPEQASGEHDIDGRSDIYSLGCVLYEMLTGQPPYTGATAAAILARKATQAPPSVCVVRETVPVALERAVTKALARSPADRFASARQFAEALERSDASPDALRRLTRSRAGRLVSMTLGAAAVLAIVLETANISGRGPNPIDPPRRKIESLAVLPLENLSRDAEQDYFAAGIHEALIVDLGKLSGLRRVSARPSVLRYGTIDRPLQQIARELGVDALITGTVLHSANRVRVTATLIDPATEQPLWSDSYEREVRDVLALQDEIVGDIASNVQLRLSPRERTALSHARRVSPDAYRAYLMGRFQLNKFTADGFEKSVALFEQAVAIDSTEALAYAGLAQAYTIEEAVTGVLSPDAIARAKQAALRAVALDETLAEAHDALASAKIGEWDHAGVEQSLRRALALNPNLADAHIHYAWHLAIFGTEDQAIAELKRGIELDPLSPLYQAWLGGMYWEFGRFDDAIREAEKALELQADFPVALFVLALAFADKGEFQRAIEAAEEAAATYPNHNFTWNLARTYAVAGRTSDARRIMAALEAGRPGDAVHPWFIAAAYGALGDREKAIDWLEKAYDGRSLFLANLRRDRAAGFDLRPLHGHPRFPMLLRRVKLVK